MGNILPSTLPLVIVLSLAFILFIYWVSGRVSAKGVLKNIGGKVAPYACGEDFPPEELKINLEKFFIFAVYFLIFDVLAFILATSFPVAGLIPAVYCSIVLMAVVALLSVGRHR